MKYVFIIAAALCSCVKPKPCKVVKAGMPSAEVLKLAGKPTEVVPLGEDINEDGSRRQIEVWQYGEPKADGNQRVTLIGDRVESVIANGKKYDELLEAFRMGKFPKEELSVRIDKMNIEECR